MRRFALIATLGLMAAAPAVSAPTPKAPAPAGAPAPAKTAGPLGASNLPLDISSENSEQFQQERRAVWWGNVEAIQGDSRMRTPRLTAFFAPRDSTVPKAAAGMVGGDSGKVERIEAEGPVYYVTPTQQAKGDHGTYMADSNTITLTGNVILTQDKNVAAGDKLVIDRNTGHSTLTSAPGKGPAPNRVRAVLYPSQAQNQTGPGATSTPAQPPKPAGHP